MTPEEFPGGYLHPKAGERYDDQKKVFADLVSHSISNRHRVWKCSTTHSMATMRVCLPTDRPEVVKVTPLSDTARIKALSLVSAKKSLRGLISKRQPRATGHGIRWNCR